MSINEKILALADKYEQYVIDCRRKVHALAEPCTQEFQTKAFILEQVKELGLPYEEVPTNSVIVKLDTGRPGMTVALRADIDALPVPENPENLAGPRVCRSEHEGFCHACGHDGHTAMLLGAMHVINEMKDELSGTILFCFEEGEEQGTGFAALLEALEKYHVDRCWGIHVYAGLTEGKISVDAGPRMATGCGLGVTFKGKGGHGSRPDQAANPVFAGAAFLVNLETAMAQQITAGETVTQGVTMFHGGDAANVIPETATINGTFRFFNIEEGQKAVDRYKAVAEATAGMYRCSVEFDPGVKVFGVPVINDKDCAAVAAEALNDILPEGTVVECEPWYASESFGQWLIRWPGVFAFLGIQNEAAGFGALHHNEKFDFDEKVLKTGCIATAKYVAAWLGR